ncbi:hypothetical protein GTPT_0441 [Tatumella ptyseos ATCC 33301]|uniref:Uncharacterized protein n=3 Tax=Erwiniaceae TaxID=1903409 RepID=A0A085JP71_9GAMM|nr:hypothetical protein GTPT_0441 [Tatumella ptyseos ATCC 33301]SQK71652.1 Uncharacterised protein [Tatumella ptyseos]
MKMGKLPSGSMINKRSTVTEIISVMGQSYPLVSADISSMIKKAWRIEFIYLPARVHFVELGVIGKSDYYMQAG